MADDERKYPHIERPWKKWYENTYDMELENTNLTDYIKKKNVGREDLIAETYYKNEISYRELFQRIDDASRALRALGVDKGKTVFNLVPNIPESGQIWLGATQLGAISDFADPRPDSMDLKANALKILELLKYEKADYIVALDLCYTSMLKPIENELKELGINNIVVVSASDSMNIRGIIDYLKDVIEYNKIKNQKLVSGAVKKLKFYEALYQKITKMSADKKAFATAVKDSPIEIIRYKDLVAETRNVPFTEVKDENLINYIGHTSGTSGAKPKPIPLTNKNHIFATEQAFKMGVNVWPGQTAIHELPFFSPLGADNNYILDLACGANLLDVPEFEINEFGYLVKKYKPNIIIGTPSWFSQLPKCQYIKDIDLSNLERVIYGGDSMDKKIEVELENWLKDHNGPTYVEKGHGMSEYCGGGTYATGKWNRYESIGIPYPDTIYAIVDPNIEDRLVPVKTVDKDGFIAGELVVSSDAVTEGILNGEVIVPHYEMDGRSYIRTRDLVKMDKDGIFYFDARKDRSFTRYDGYKIKPYEIENEIKKSELVKDCIIVNYFDENKNGFMPIAHIILVDDVKVYNKDDYERIVKEIVYKNIIKNPDMSSRQIPSKFKFRSDFPLTKNSKVNYQALVGEELDETEINVEIEETNLAVKDIKIYSTEKGKEKVKK